MSIIHKKNNIALNFFLSLKRKFIDLIGKYVSIKLLITLIICILMFFLAKYRIDIGFNQAVDYDVAIIPKYDSKFFLTGATNFFELNSNPLALIKNRGYMYILMLSHYLKIPPNALSGILFVIASLIIFEFTYCVTKNKIVSFIFYTLILYHPIAFFQHAALQLYRNDVFLQFAFMYLASMFLLFYLIIKKEAYIINVVLALFCGITFAMSYFLNETGVLHLLIVVFFTILFIFYILFFVNKNKKYKILFALLPLIFSSTLLFAYKYVNYRTYGVFVDNMRTDGEVGKFIRNVQSIESDTQNRYVWCTFDQLDKAYKASYTFRNNSNIYNYLKKSKFGITGTLGWQGDFFGWGITNLLNERNISYKEAANIFKNINKDLNEAFKFGTLEKTEKFSLGKNLGFLTNEDLKVCIEITKSVTSSMLGLKFYDLQICNFGKSNDKSNEFIEYFNIDTEKEFVDYREFVTEMIAVYSKLQVFFVIFLFIVWIAIIIIDIIDVVKWFLKPIKKIEIKKIVVNYNVYMILSVGFLLMSILYVFSLSNFFIWFYEYNEEYDTQFSFSNLGYNYGSIVYSFLYVSLIFGIAALINVIRTKFTLANRKINSNFILRNNAVTIIAFVLISILVISIMSIFGGSNSITTKSKLLESIKKNVSIKRDINIKKNEKMNYIKNLFAKNKRKKIDLKKISDNVLSSKNIIDNIVIVGDETKNFIKDKIMVSFKKTVKTYGLSDKTVTENIDLYEKGIVEGDGEIIILANGINDYLRGTDLSQFKESIERLCETAYKVNKVMIFHSYMKGKSAKISTNGNYIVCDYDVVLKELTNYYNNVFYVDCCDLDTFNYLSVDKIHFNEYYYEKLVSRILETIVKKLKL